MTVRRLPLPLALVVAVVALLALLAWLVFHAGMPAPSAPAAEAPGADVPSVSLVVARLGSIAEIVSAQGRVGPPAGSDAKLAFAVPGLVQSVDVRVGERVVAGQTLARLDPAVLANAVAQARADDAASSATYANGSTGSSAAHTAELKLQAALAHRDGLRRGGEAALSDAIAAESARRQAALKVDTDKRALTRTQTLFAGGVSPRKDVEAARAQLDADVADQRSADAKLAAARAGYSSALRQADADLAQAQSDLASARAQGGTNAAQRDAARAKLAAAQQALASGTLRAPADGVVVSILKHAGEAADTTTPVLDVAPPFNRQITLSVPGSDVRRIAVGNAVALQLVRQHRTSQGRVVAVVPAVDPTSQASTVVVDGLPPGAIAGEAVSARITVGRAGGIVVPSSAIVTDPQTSKTVVFVRTHDPKQPFDAREVTVRTDDGHSAVLDAGVKPGERLAAQGAYDLLAPAGG